METLIRWGAALALLLATAASQAAPDPASGDERVQYAQLILRGQMIIRVPVRMAPVAPAPALIQWKEGRGPRCVSARTIIGAALLSQNSVDLILRDRSRVRAKLQRSCPALDYYYGFYLTPNPDGMVCADRDMIRSRMGGQCEIDAFRTLKGVPRE